MKKVIFFTATRADFGKLRSLIEALETKQQFEIVIIVTGMHLSEKFGLTFLEIAEWSKSKEVAVIKFANKIDSDDVNTIFATTILNLGAILSSQNAVDLLIYHGDRLECLAAASVSALQGIRSLHIEGGEISGTTDEYLRHAITKLSDFHAVSNERAAKNVLRLGEDSCRVKIIGNPSLDALKNLPSERAVRNHYGISFQSFAISILHPDTLNLDSLDIDSECYFQALVESGQNFILIGPNSDIGNGTITKHLHILKNENKFKFFPSMRFESFLKLLSMCEFLIGNSSSGIMETPMLGVPTINVGERQKGRDLTDWVLHVPFDKDIITSAIKDIGALGTPNMIYGDGFAGKYLSEWLCNDSFWEIPSQKRLVSNDD